MNFPDGLFNQWLIIGAYGPLIVVLFWCIKTAPWSRLANSNQLNIWLGTIVSLVLIWSLKVNIKPGLTLHLLGSALFTLMFGRQLAILGLSLALLAVTSNSFLVGGAIGWEVFGLSFLTMIVIPVFLAWNILQIVEWLFPAHFFVYIFLVAFFGSAANVVLTGLASTLLLGATGIYPLRQLFGDYFVSYVLLAFAEAWLTGMLITIMVVYKPDWVCTFDDRRYLWNK